MRIIRPVSPEEMDQRFGGLMDALRSDPEDVIYCSKCDGLRVKGHECAPLAALLEAED